MYKINQNVAVGNSTKLNVGVIITQTFDTEPAPPVTTPRVVRRGGGKFGIQGSRGLDYMILHGNVIDEILSLDWHESIPIWKDIIPPAILLPDNTWTNIATVYKIIIWGAHLSLVFDNRWDVYD